MYHHYKRQSNLWEEKNELGNSDSGHLSKCKGTENFFAYLGYLYVSAIFINKMIDLIEATSKYANACEYDTHY